MFRQFKEKNKNWLRLKLKSALKIEQISNKYNIDLFYLHLFTMRSQCFKSVIQSGRSLFLSKIKHTSLKLPVGVSPRQLVNLHRNRRYFVIKLHTWFWGKKGGFYL
jgi:hypothetical protein